MKKIMIWEDTKYVLFYGHHIYFVIFVLAEEKNLNFGTLMWVPTYSLFANLFLSLI